MKKDRYSMKYSARVYADPWEKYESFCTTGQFTRIGNETYYRHCGPTAVTNLILTLWRAEKDSKEGRREDTFVRKDGIPAARSKKTSGELAGNLTDEDIRGIFQEVAKTGQRMLIYYNTNLFGKIGGTSDFLMRPYLLRCFRKFGLNARVGKRYLMNEENVREALGRGSILYVELHHHPKYKNHHVICYSAEELLIKKDQRQVGFYLKCADGWTNQPVYLSIEQMPFASGFFEIELP